jgi:hypothetical protein
MTPQNKEASPSKQKRIVPHMITTERATASIAAALSKLVS